MLEAVSIKSKRYEYAKLLLILSITSLILQILTVITSIGIAINKLTNASQSIVGFVFLGIFAIIGFMLFIVTLVVKIILTVEYISNKEHPKKENFTFLVLSYFFEIFSVLIALLILDEEKNSKFTVSADTIHSINNRIKKEKESIVRNSEKED